MKKFVLNLRIGLLISITLLLNMGALAETINLEAIHTGWMNDKCLPIESLYITFDSNSKILKFVKYGDEDYSSGVKAYRTKWSGYKPLYEHSFKITGVSEERTEKLGVPCLILHTSENKDISMRTLGYKDVQIFIWVDNEELTPFWNYRLTEVNNQIYEQLVSLLKNTFDFDKSTKSNSTSTTKSSSTTQSSTTKPKSSSTTKSSTTSNSPSYTKPFSTTSSASQKKETAFYGELSNSALKNYKLSFKDAVYKIVGKMDYTTLSKNNEDEQFKLIEKTFGVTPDATLIYSKKYSKFRFWNCEKCFILNTPIRDIEITSDLSGDPYSYIMWEYNFYFNNAKEAKNFQAKLNDELSKLGMYFLYQTEHSFHYLAYQNFAVKEAFAHNYYHDSNNEFSVKLEIYISLN